MKRYPNLLPKRLASRKQANMSKGLYLPYFILVLIYISLLSLSACGTSIDQPSAESSSTIGNGAGKAVISWEPPKTNSDSTPLTDLAGFKVYYGRETPLTKANSTESIDVGNTTSYTLSGLESGAYYFVVTAYDTSGNESDFSEEAAKTL